MLVYRGYRTCLFWFPIFPHCWDRNTTIENHRDMFIHSCCTSPSEPSVSRSCPQSKIHWEIHLEIQGFNKKDSPVTAHKTLWSHCFKDAKDLSWTPIHKSSHKSATVLIWTRRLRTLRRLQSSYDSFDLCDTCQRPSLLVVLPTGWVSRLIPWGIGHDHHPLSWMGLNTFKNYSTSYEYVY